MMWLTGIRIIKNRSKRSVAFSLLELIVVMVIIASVLAIAAPSLKGFFQASKHEQLARKILNLTHYARQLAVSEGYTYYLTFNETEKTISLYSYAEQKKVTYQNSSASMIRFADNMQIKVEDDTQVAIKDIEFQPNGMNSPSTIRVTGHPDYDYLIYSDAYSQPYQLIKEDK